MGYGNYQDSFLASQPVRIHFAGWETDTYRLQQNGWQLSASQVNRMHMHRGMQIAMNHPEYRIRGVTDVMNLDDSFLYKQNGWCPEIDVRAQLSSDFINNSIRMNDMSSFHPIDAEPQYMQRQDRMSEHMHFAPNLVRTQELIVPEQSVDELLEMIISKQAVNREQIIRRRVREQGQEADFNQRTNVHAQIISIAG